MDGKKCDARVEDFLSMWDVVRELVKTPISPKAAYNLQRNATELYGVFKRFKSKQEALVRKHGILDEESKMYRLEPTHEGYKKDLQELLNEVDTIHVREIPIGELTMSISAQDLNIIDCMICEDKMIVNPNDVLSIIH